MMWENIDAKILLNLDTFYFLLQTYPQLLLQLLLLPQLLNYGTRFYITIFPDLYLFKIRIAV